MSSESQRRFWCNFCCTSNTNAAEGFAIVHLIILGMAEFFMFHGVDNDMYLNNNWPLLCFFTYWLMLSILVVIGTKGHQRHGHQNHRLLLVSTVLGWLGILGFAAYLFLSYFVSRVIVSFGFYGFYDVQETLKISLGCVWLFISFWYVLCMYGAMLEARETNTPGIDDGPSGVEKGQPGTEIITVPSIPTQGQQVYLTPGSLGVEMEKPGKATIEPSDPPPSYYELFQANDIAINHI